MLPSDYINILGPLLQGICKLHLLPPMSVVAVNTVLAAARSREGLAQATLPEVRRRAKLLDTMSELAPPVRAISRQEKPAQLSRLVGLALRLLPLL